MVEKITIKAGLPFCLHKVDERWFQVDEKTRIRFFKEKIEPSRRTESSKNIEFLNDRWGTDAYSRIEMETKKKIDLSDSDAALGFTTKILNKFISIYRYFDEESPHLVNLIKSDLLDFMVTNGGKSTFMVVLGGGITPLNPEKVLRVSDSLEGALTSGYEIPLWRELILNAEHYWYVGDYRMAILESTTALELVVFKFISGELSAVDVSNGEIKEFNKEIGISKALNVVIKYLVPSEYIPTDLFKICKTTINKRNKIVHEGRREVDRESTKESIKAIYQLVQILLEQGRDMEQLQDKYKHTTKLPE